jgi:hypothetical protein
VNRRVKQPVIAKSHQIQLHTNLTFKRLSWLCGLHSCSSFTDSFKMTLSINDLPVELLSLMLNQEMWDVDNDDNQECKAWRSWGDEQGK